MVSVHGPNRNNTEIKSRELQRVSFINLQYPNSIQTLHNIPSLIETLLYKGFKITANAVRFI